MPTRGRPKNSGIRLDPEDITKLARAGATQEDMANKLGVSIATIERRLRQTKYRQALLIGKGELCTSLRAKQVQIALSGNVQMLKWLGEQLLRQSHTHRIVDKGRGQERGDVDAARRGSRAHRADGSPMTE
jgi:DNA-binding XRE family transcriptional regulator